MKREWETMLRAAAMVVGLLAAQVVFAQESDNLCGPRCAVEVMAAFGHKADVEGVAKLSGASERGTSLTGLGDAIAANGLKTVAMKIGAKQIALLKCPAIVHTWDNHFLVVNKVDHEGKILLTDPPDQPYEASIEELEERYSGFALLVAKNEDVFPEVSEEGADIRVDKYVWDFGVVEEGEVVQHTFTCKNVGSDELQILNIDKSCGCTVGMATEDHVAPGATSEVQVVMDTTGRRGKQTQNVTISCNDPITPAVQLQVVGFVEPFGVPVSPRNIDFGQVRHGRNASWDVLVPAGSRDIVVHKATVDTDFLSVKLTRSPDGSSCVAHVEVSPEAPLGRLDGKVVLSTSHPKHPEVAVPVTALITGDVSVFPDTMFMGILKIGYGGRKKIKISSASDSPLVIEKIVSPMPDFLYVRAIPVTEGREYELVATLKCDTPSGVVKGDIVVHTNNEMQPEISIPVYALVGD